MITLALFALLVMAMVVLTRGATRGFLIGVASASYIWTIIAVVTQTTGTAATRMGDTAERRAAGQLGKLGGEWSVLHDIPFPGRGNVDHVAIGTRGVFAIETKWRSTAWEVAPPDQYVVAAASQAYHNAVAVQELLADAGVLVKVIPVLTWWSAHTPEGRSNEPQRVGATRVLPGDQLTDWLAKQPELDLDIEQRRAVKQLLIEHTRVRELSAGDFGPDSWRDILLPWIAVPFAATFGLLASLVVISALRGFYACGVGITGLLALGWLVARWQPSRPAALGWTAGVMAGIVALGGALLMG